LNFKKVIIYSLSSQCFQNGHLLITNLGNYIKILIFLINNVYKLYNTFFGEKIFGFDLEIEVKLVFKSYYYY